jgi:hypothetical protein
MPMPMKIHKYLFLLFEKIRGKHRKGRHATRPSRCLKKIWDAVVSVGVRSRIDAGFEKGQDFVDQRLIGFAFQRMA